MGSFVATALATAHRVVTVDLGGVGNAEDIKTMAGVDVSGYRRWVDNYAVRHAISHHGDDAAEKSRGQVGLTTADLSLYGEIISKPDSIALGDLTKVGRQTIVSQRVIGDHRYIVVEELRPKRQRLAMVTMWKRKK